MRSPIGAAVEALRSLVVTMVRRGPATTLPDTSSGWSAVSALVVGRLDQTRGNGTRTREFVPAQALRHPLGVDRAFSHVPESFSDRRRIVFTDGPVLPIGEPAAAVVDGVRVAEHAFPWTVIAVGESLVVVRDDDDGVLRVLANARELTTTLMLLHDTLWVLLGHEAQLRESTQVLPRRLRTVLETLASGATDQAAQRALELSSRTFSRRTSELLTALGARSRFQAGVEAAHRHWV
jgi:hypothetical protein